MVERQSHCSNVTARVWQSVVKRSRFRLWLRGVTLVGLLGLWLPGPAEYGRLLDVEIASLEPERDVGQLSSDHTACIERKLDFGEKWDLAIRFRGSTNRRRLRFPFCPFSTHGIRVNVTVGGESYSLVPGDVVPPMEACDHPQYFVGRNRTVEFPVSVRAEKARPGRMRFHFENFAPLEVPESDMVSVSIVLRFPYRGGWFFLADSEGNEVVLNQLVLILNRE